MSRRTTGLVLAASLAIAVAASGVYLANADAAETAVPGRVQAEAYAAESGAQTENTADAGGGKDVGWLANGDWLRYDNISVGATVTARVASNTSAGGTVELHTGTPAGPLLATFGIARTGGWQSWVTLSAAAATHPAGVQTVVAVMRSASREDFVNLNWFTFGATPAPAPAPTPTATPAPTPPATGGPPTGDGWVSVDPAARRNQLAAFDAMTPRPITGNPVRVSEFNASCTVSHDKPDDPIVFPGLAGASHRHSFLGNDSTDASTTTESLLANTGSTCKPLEDLSAYWIPTLLGPGGAAIEPHGVTVYYGSRLKDPTKTVPFPQGFRMIAGDAKRQVATPDGAPGQFWCAGAGGQTGRSTDGNWPVCAKTAELTFQLTFPDCWDGVHLDSPDHKSHVGGTGPDGTCASGKFPVAIPSISFVIGYPTPGSAAGFTLSSGMASSMHGDVFLAWNDDALGHRVKDCVVQKAKCTTAGTF